jgi:Kef-type K+ transport system membrane component KefB
LIGLVILSVVAGLTQGNEVTIVGVAQTAGVAIGFLAATLLVGRFVVPPLMHATRHIDLPGTATMAALILALGLAWLASDVGSALILGAFAAGLLLHGTQYAHEIERGVANLGHFFVPIFFVAVGAAVDLSVLNPMDAANHQTLMVGGLLIVAAVVGKFAAGYAPIWFRGNKKIIGVGMIPRGEVGLIFAQKGLVAGVFDLGLFSAVTLMVMVTTFMAPPLLKLLFPRTAPPKHVPEGIEELVTEA